ncbi:hypothetical protein AFLA_002698 [Aspergillus flavus NRRL3357]|nr:hypothetical protein AFLA_002698 [Aspergillus flavus NRRL3357]
MNSIVSTPAIPVIHGRDMNNARNYRDCFCCGSQTCTMKLTRLTTFRAGFFPKLFISTLLFTVSTQQAGLGDV